MLELLRRVSDNIRGRGEAAITIPIFDGALKPNSLLEDATILDEFEAPEDLASDGKTIYLADGQRILSHESGEWKVTATLDRPVTALACMPGGGLAVALDGKEVRILGGLFDGRSWKAVDGKSFNAVNGVGVRQDGSLAVSDGSAEYPYPQWSHDVMTKGHTGRVILLNPADGGAKVLASGLSYAFGVLASGGTIWFSESWKHRVVKLDANGRTSVVVDHLPGYPCRLSPASDGGAWLSAFAGRTQLIEFVLREPTYRKRMVAEVDPKYWIAPALSSGRTFLEPLQGAGVKMRGVLKPWAPPRSYGLVIKLSAAGLPQYSFHSRLGGRNHGVVATGECDGFLFVLSKGSGRVLKMKVPAQGGI
ncbi:MAG: hypothetical protein EOS78_25215 [Mesorhizobium sp.]|uniref:hypothetical protein n=1 Tax=unclassified Mesorhizobium TaxID=325217 RepID=UPI000FE56C39|nr:MULTISPECIES: hypothetical protein [unclassified Mesorhizobium]RWE31941.1 MAG: hypothetical protein EOS78_25215 [Mesorhizobium sp.]TGP88056.1 hypothetical protein EN861_29100 [Mesorhizobium sp. M8A.F.Ca.ET.218.01.1.1]TGT15637.1 hypothetical protein EN856_27620 [Mesorhizobium sp. M8A.F.Ca.ET.213.01.1.1]